MHCFCLDFTSHYYSPSLALDCLQEQILKFIHLVDLSLLSQMDEQYSLAQHIRDSLPPRFKVLKVEPLTFPTSLHVIVAVLSYSPSIP